jgi:hypothetical protein
MPAPRPAPTLASLTLLALLSGCPETEADDIQCSPFSDDDEVGLDACDETEGGDAGPLAPDECIYKEEPNVEGYRVQCEGEFHTKIDFKVVGMNCVDAVGDEFCSQIHPFGPPHDAYEAPDVMACCGEDWDPEQWLGIYQDYCMYDLVAQACASMAKRLEQAVESGDFETPYGDFTNKATNLQQYVESHFEDCALSLYDGDIDPDPGELVSKWEVPDKLGLGGWWPAKNIVVYVEAGTEVADVHRPEDPAQWLACNGARDNDDEIFEDHTNPEGSIVVGVDLFADVEGRLSGPVIGSGAVTSTATFAPGCVDQGCANASWSYDERDGDFTMEELELYAANFELTNGASSLTVERARIELWKQAPGSKVFDASGSVIGYRVDAGQAWFYVAGLANGLYGRYMAVNATDIEISVSRGLWTIRAFDIESVDAADRTWTITLDESRWQR